jgi:leucyl/phenylalanyl-tRNA--protein transferase
MPVFELDEQLVFPSADLAEPDGLLAVGGDLSEQRLRLAYRSGLFPWYEGTQILWWAPDPRFVLFPPERKISKSMRSLLRKDSFQFTQNKAFEQVITQCKVIKRRGQAGTWINKEMIKAYTALHHSGWAHSAEVWLNDQLVGGLYGIQMGKVFFGESMFSRVSNASKYAFLQYVETLEREGVQLIDCQMYTPHLESLGARHIPRKQFLQELSQLIPA